jgi:hypothetical protein
MDGLYLYCIREKNEGPSVFHTEGIDGKGEVFTVVHHGLEAVVSKVLLSEFASDEIQKKARDDLDWIKEKAVIHENVIEDAMKRINGSAGVVPMRFGIIFNDETGLKETLDRDYAKIMGLLNRLQGRQEWSVKIYLMDEECFELMVKDKSEDISAKEREMASMPEGMAYFMEEELNETIRDEVNKELDVLLDNLCARLGTEAAESAKLKTLDGEMTGKIERMVHNRAFLIQGDRVDSFKKTLEVTNTDFKTKGLHLEYSGPWPPFNFVHLEE